MPTPGLDNASKAQTGLVSGDTLAGDVNFKPILDVAQSFVSRFVSSTNDLTLVGDSVFIPNRPIERKELQTGKDKVLEAGKSAFQEIIKSAEDGVGVI